MEDNTKDLEKVEIPMEAPKENEKDKLQLLKNLVQSEDELKKEEKRQKVLQIIRKTLTYIFLFALAVIMVFPFYWMLISSVKTIDEYYLTIPTFWPQNFQFSKYHQHWQRSHRVILLFEYLILCSRLYLPPP